MEIPDFQLKDFQLKDFQFDFKNKIEINFLNDFVNIVISDDIAFIVSRNYNNNDVEKYITVYNLLNKTELFKIFTGHSITTIEKSDCGKFLITGGCYSKDNSRIVDLRLIDIEKQSVIKTFFVQCKNYVFNGFNNFVSDGITVFNVFFGSNNDIYSLDNHYIKRWDINTGKCLLQYKNDGSYLDNLLYEKNINFLFIVSQDEMNIHCFNGNSLKLINKLNGHLDHITAVCFVDFGYFSDKCIASASKDSTIRIWKIKKFECVKIIQIGIIIKFIATTPDNRFFITNSESIFGKIFIFDIYNNSKRNNIKMVDLKKGDDLKKGEIFKIVVSQNIKIFSFCSNFINILKKITPFPIIVIMQDDVNLKYNSNTSQTGLLRCYSNGEIKLFKKENIINFNITVKTIVKKNSKSEIELSGDKLIFIKSAINSDILIESINAIINNLICKEVYFNEKSIILNYRFDILQFILTKKLLINNFVPLNIIKIYLIF